MTEDAGGPFSFRLEPAVVEHLRGISEHHNLPQPLMLEHLILKEAWNCGLVQPDDPSKALHELLDGIRAWQVQPHSDITLEVFRLIKNDAKMLRLWERATTPARGERAAKRRQRVNNRIARYIKHLIGWNSDDEVTLPKDAGE